MIHVHVVVLMRQHSRRPTWTLDRPYNITCCAVCLRTRDLNLKCICYYFPGV